MKALSFGVCVILAFSLCECSYPFETSNQNVQIGGSLIVPGTNPYQVAILRRLNLNFDILDGLKFVCGGSLIAAQWVLTSAQCVENPNLKIKLGVNNIRSHDRFHVAFDITEENIKLHPNYTRGGFNNDVALIKLPRKVEFNQYIQPVALPIGNHETYVNKTVFTSGWSRVNPFTPVSDFLRQATVKVIENERCQASYKSPFFYITCNHMCTSGGGWFSELSCSGDAGAPLVYFNSELSRPEQIGIALRPPFDCEGKPAIYTKMSSYTNWIDEMLACERGWKGDDLGSEEDISEELEEEAILFINSTSPRSTDNLFKIIVASKANDDPELVAKDNLGVGTNDSQDEQRGVRVVAKDVPEVAVRDAAERKFLFPPMMHSRSAEEEAELHPRVAEGRNASPETKTQPDAAEVL